MNDFDPQDPLYYAVEHCGSEPRVKQLRWVNDFSLNLEFYSAEDAAQALQLLSHESVMDPSALTPQEQRQAKSYSKKPDRILKVRQANAGDQKPRGAAQRSKYYEKNPDVRGNREREPRKQPPPKRDFLDYGEEEEDVRDRRRRR